MKTKLTLTLITLAGLTVFAGYIRGGNSAAAALEARVNPHYKGASAFNLAGAGPNVARCGAFPENIELSFTGQGIGQGRFNLYSNLTPCNGQTPPAFVSFEGMIQVPQ